MHDFIVSIVLFSSVEQGYFAAEPSRVPQPLLSVGNRDRLLGGTELRLPKTAHGIDHLACRCTGISQQVAAGLNSAFGTMTWTPLLRSTSSVTSTSPATLTSM